MLRKFFDGMIFGAGFAVALASIWSIYIFFVVPPMMRSVSTETKMPEFKNPTDAKIIKGNGGAADNRQKFSFFKNSGARMEIPPGGGILGMAPLSTPANAKRQSTYQIWLTQTEFWQIQTKEDQVQIERLPRPENAGADDISRLMREKLGIAAGLSSMTVSEYEIQRLKSTGKSERDGSMNGTLKVSVEGVVFFLPDPYTR